MLLLLADLVVDSATAAPAPAALRYKKGFRSNKREQEQQVVDLGAPALLLLVVVVVHRGWR